MSTLTRKQERVNKELKNWELRYNYGDSNMSIYNIILRKSREIDPNGDDYWDRPTYEMQIHINPTGNCQLVSIGNFENMFCILDDTSEEVARALFQTLFRYINANICSKQMLLFDVREVAYKKFRTALRSISSFVSANSFVYRSSNGTRMRTSVNKIDTSKLCPLGLGNIYSVEEGGHHDFNDVYHENLNDGTDEDKNSDWF